MEDPVAAVAEKIVEYIRREDVEGLDRQLNMSDADWRQELRYEFDLDRMLDAIFRNDILIPKLIMCDIKTIAAFHYAALRGVDPILERFVLQHQIPVDMCVQGGNTALHFACFAGMVDTVILLVERFHADVNRKDRYGWSPLHYAAIEGCLTVIEFLVSHGADISARDKDGTTAAFRAQAYGHTNIVSYFIQSTGDEDLLLVENTSSDRTDGDAEQEEGEEEEQFYATLEAVRLKKALSNGSGDVDYEPVGKGGQEVAVAQGSALGRGKEEVASLVRGQLLDVLAGRDEDPYMNPVSGGRVGGAGPGGGKVPLDIGVNTLTRILKDEFLRFRMEHDVKKADGSSKPPDPEPACADDHHQGTNKDYSLQSDYEDIGKLRQVVAERQSAEADSTRIGRGVVDEAGAPEVSGPPLPPRNSSSIVLADKGEGGVGGTGGAGEGGGEGKRLSVERKKSKEKKRSKKKTPDRMFYMTLTPADVARLQDPSKTKALLILNRFDHSGTVMEACFQALVQNIGDIDNWKKLSTALPLRNKPEAVKRLIRNLEASFPADPHRQALGALQSWRYYFGEAANVEALVEAMGKCGLEDKVSLVERAAEEFTA